MGINSAAASARTRLGAHRSGKPTEGQLQRVITSSQTLSRDTSIEGMVSWFERNLILPTLRASVVTDSAICELFIAFWILSSVRFSTSQIISVKVNDIITTVTSMLLHLQAQNC